MSDLSKFEQRRRDAALHKSPVKKAAALKYDPAEDAVPVLTAVGTGVTAEHMVEKAHESDVPVVEDSTTAEVLSKLSVGDSIPPALYEAVAQILVFISDLDSGLKEKYNTARQ